jgi:regulatory protein
MLTGVAQRFLVVAAEDARNRRRFLLSKRWLGFGGGTWSLAMDRERLAEVREGAMRLLARREHSQQELRQKLLLREHPEELIDAAIAELAAENLLSDARFAEEFVRSRREKGFGPQRIRAELRQRGVDPTVAESHLRSPEEDWQARALTLYRRRFGDKPPRDHAERSKRYRFLMGRGFTPDQIRRVLDDQL